MPDEVTQQEEILQMLVEERPTSGPPALGCHGIVSLDLQTQVRMTVRYQLTQESRVRFRRDHIPRNTQYLTLERLRRDPLPRTTQYLELEKLKD